MHGRSWDREVDAVVVGSGAAALAAAVAASAGGLEVEVLEKTAHLGGTTAFSGGGVWIPMNSHMAEVGAEDSAAEALSYIHACCGGSEPDPELIEFYVDRSREAIEFLEHSTPLRFAASRTFSDYFVGLPGAKLAGRTLDPVPFGSRDALLDWDGKIRSGPHYPRVTLDELAGGGDPDDDRGGGGQAVGYSSRVSALAAERERLGVRTLGGSLVASLLRGALDHGVAVRTNTPVLELVRAGDAVAGVVAQASDDRLTIRCRRGVVLAAGGFEWNQDLVRTFLGVPELKPASPPTSTGDGLLMALRAGAALANMTRAWAFPTAWDGYSTYDNMPLHMVATPRSNPGCITVNSRGRRFTNEGVCYMDFGLAHRIYDPVSHCYPNRSPVWAIFDHRAREQMVMGDLTPGSPTPRWVREADTIGELADIIGVDRKGLCAEVQRFNTFVDGGSDLDFGRGTVWFEGFTCGGPDPKRSLARLDTPPFYGVEIHDGALGTAGGVRIDKDGRVKSAGGGPIQGLYAAGNTAASIFGEGYPAGGATLGPAVTFAYFAGRHLAKATQTVTAS